MLWAVGVNGMLWACGSRSSSGAESYRSWFLNDELESNKGRKSLCSLREEHVEAPRRMNVRSALGELKLGPEWLSGSQRSRPEVLNELC